MIGHQPGAKSASHTKRGPGRYHKQGAPGAQKPKGRGFKGVTFAPPRPQSAFVRGSAAWHKQRERAARLAHLSELRELRAQRAARIA